MKRIMIIAVLAGALSSCGEVPCEIDVNGMRTVSLVVDNSDGTPWTCRTIEEGFGPARDLFYGRHDGSEVNHRFGFDGTVASDGLVWTQEARVAFEVHTTVVEAECAEGRSRFTLEAGVIEVFHTSACEWFDPSSTPCLTSDRPAECDRDPRTCVAEIEPTCVYEFTFESL